MSKVSAMCQLKGRFLKDTCPRTHFCEFFRKGHEWLSSGFRVLGFSLFGFAITPEAQSCEAIIEGFPLKLMRPQNFIDH
jgi:hypothetical protein